MANLNNMNPPSVFNSFEGHIPTGLGYDAR
jgi:hypothetical protein